MLIFEAAEKEPFWAFLTPALCSRSHLSGCIGQVCRCSHKSAGVEVRGEKTPDIRREISAAARRIGAAFQLLTLSPK